VSFAKHDLKTWNLGCEVMAGSFSDGEATFPDAVLFRNPSTGLYELTLGSKPELVSGQATVFASGAVDMFAKITSYDQATGVMEIRVFDGTSNSDLAAGELVHLVLFIRRTTAPQGLPSVPATA
jgi:hypothetical protein